MNTMDGNLCKIRWQQQAGIAQQIRIILVRNLEFVVMEIMCTIRVPRPFPCPSAAKTYPHKYGKLSP
jgi:hypothetical protein